MLQGIRSKATSPTQTVSRAVSSSSQQLIQPLWKQIGNNSIFIRLAALSGASAVCFAAYGRHKLKDTPESKEFRNIYESANNMHLIHSVVLLAVPLVKRPAIVSCIHIRQFARSFLIRMGVLPIISRKSVDWHLIRGWNSALQWHMLLQGHPQGTRRRRQRQEAANNEFGTDRRRLSHSRLVKFAILMWNASASDRIHGHGHNHNVLRYMISSRWCDTQMHFMFFRSGRIQIFK